jgi:hypothetical protein
VQQAKGIIRRQNRDAQQIAKDDQDKKMLDPRPLLPQIAHHLVDRRAIDHLTYGVDRGSQFLRNVCYAGVDFHSVRLAFRSAAA